MIFKKIFTTNEKSDNDNYKEIKKSIMGKDKALVIQLNDDHRVVSKFEKINHYYVLCKNDADKFLMIFILKKLSLIQGKLVIYCNDIM